MMAGTDATRSGTSSREDALSRLGFMAGCWELRRGPTLIHEHWMSPLGGMMLGMSRTVVRDSVREFEHLRIETRNGVATYVAHPSGQAETAFVATVVRDTLAVFENPAHDFPRTISYRRLGADSLLARIEGPQGGQNRAISFPMRRLPCTTGG
jgi:hypothetical protein